jgi:hypothetical protein
VDVAEDQDGSALQPQVMKESVTFWSIVLFIATAIVALGWRQPLSYRFMSSQEVYALEHPETPVPVPAMETPQPWMWDPKRSTRLDQPASSARGKPGQDHSLLDY